MPVTIQKARAGVPNARLGGRIAAIPRQRNQLFIFPEQVVAT
jgi:hypothetical protein